jgi:co-chaperonin GroES (HSP10)
MQASSKYLDAFTAVAREHAAAFELVGDYLIVEVIPDEEFKTKSGLIMATSSGHQVNSITADKPTFVRVLMVGAGTPKDADSTDLVKYDVDPGDICLVGAHSIKYFSVFGQLVTYGETRIGLTLAGEIQMRFKGQTGFDRFFGSLNQQVKTQVEQRPLG